MTTRFAAVILVGALLSGCYRTHYENFSPNNPDRSAQHGIPVPAGRGWQHFFLFGWIPSERVIDAREKCGGAGNIDSIETRRTFLEGLIEAFAGYIVNVYSPYNGVVNCKAPQAPPPPPPMP